MVSNAVMVLLVAVTGSPRSSQLAGARFVVYCSLYVSPTMAFHDNENVPFCVVTADSTVGGALVTINVKVVPP